METVTNFKFLGSKIIADGDCKYEIKRHLWKAVVELQHWDSWPPEEKNLIQGQRRGLIAQSFCVTKFY